jgi:hypothetical protein
MGENVAGEQIIKTPYVVVIGYQAVKEVVNTIYKGNPPKGVIVTLPQKETPKQ